MSKHMSVLGVRERRVREGRANAGRRATASYRGITATVYIEEHPFAEGRVRVRLAVEPSQGNFSGLATDDLYSVEAKPLTPAEEPTR